jgi:hypothetical protein
MDNDVRMASGTAGMTIYIEGAVRPFVVCEDYYRIPPPPTEEEQRQRIQHRRTLTYWDTPHNDHEI